MVDGMARDIEMIAEGAVFIPRPGFLPVRPSFSSAIDSLPGGRGLTHH